MPDTAGKAQSVTLFIAPDGDDSSSGTFDAPFATLERARDALRALRAGNELRGSAEVCLRGGTYRLTDSFELDERDSGERQAPLVYRAYSNEEVSLVGGVDLDPDAFEPVRDPAVLSRIPEEARSRVLRIDLKRQGITEYGQLQPYGFGLPGAIPGPELFFNAHPMPVARWPNEGFAKVGEVIEEGSRPRFCDLQKDPDSKDCRNVLPVFRSNATRNWTGAADMWMYGFWYYDWADEALPVKRVDKDAHEVELGVPSYYGVKSGQRYYAYNLLEELDSPGEWYLDRQHGALYFYPPSLLEGSKVQLSLLDKPLISLDRASNVVFRDLILEVGRGMGVRIAGGSNNLVYSCKLRHLGDAAVRIDGGSRNGVAGSEIRSMGNGGIYLEGGDRRTLTPGGHFSISNHIHDYSRIVRTGKPAVSLSGVGHRVAHNLIHDAPHMAVFMRGNDHVVEYNEIHDVDTETSDAGAIYMGRDWTERGNIIRYNYLHEIRNDVGGVGQIGIYLDDLASGVAVYGNVLCNVDRGFLVGGGRDNTVENNVLVNCRSWLTLDDRGLNWAAPEMEPGDEMYDGLRAVPYRDEPWKTRYPRLQDIMNDDPAVPKYNVVANNIVCDGGREYVSPIAERRGRIEHNLELAADPGFVDAKTGRLDSCDDSVVSGKLPGFQAIPVEKIGLLPSPTDVWRTVAEVWGATSRVDEVSDTEAR